MAVTRMAGLGAALRARADRAGAWLGRRRVQAVVLSAVLVSTMTLPVHAALATDVAADADWIMSARMPDGAIANYVDRQAVWPYLSNFAAMGLAKATTVTGNANYAAASWTWLGWYQSHENAQGFVTDYRMVSGALTSTGDMDSTDSYAGTFLLAAREAYRATNDLTKLKGLAAGVSGAVRAIEATQDVDGLTWAKPTWHVKYLMDQSEAYAGLLAATDIAGAIGNSTLAQQATADATRMKNGVANLWNASLNSYDWAVHDDGTHVTTNWGVLYPDALQQMWAVAFGLVDTVRAPTLATQFLTAEPNWALPAATAVIGGGSSTVGYWPTAGWALNALGNSTASTAVGTIRSAALAANRAWPFTTGNAGQLILFESGYSLPLAAAPATKLGGKSVTTTTIKGSRLLSPVSTLKPVPSTALSPTTTVKPTTTTKPPTTTTTAPLVSVSVPPNGPTITVPTP